MSDTATPSEALVASLAVDGLRPSRVQSPATVEELREIVAEEVHEGRALIPVGTGGRLTIGNIPEAYDTAICTTRMARIVAYEPADMTVTVEAGSLLADLQETLGERRQWLPLDGPGRTGTVGGMLAANAFGPLRHRFGTPRDWLLGLRVVRGDGAITRSGGRVVKNVSGYDLHKADIGALGTLGFIVEGTLKVAPAPRLESTWAIGCETAGVASSIISASHQRELSLAAAELVSPTTAAALHLDSAWTALLRVAGGDAAVRRTVRDLRDFADLAGRPLESTHPDIWDNWSTVFDLSSMNIRISVAPTNVALTAEGLDRTLAGTGVRISATASVGLIRLSFPEDRLASGMRTIEQIRQTAGHRAQDVFIESASPEIKREVDVFGTSRSDLPIMRRLKEQYDPGRVFAPGRFMGRI